MYRPDFCGVEEKDNTFIHIFTKVHVSQLPPTPQQALTNPEGTGESVKESWHICGHLQQQSVASHTHGVFINLCLTLDHFSENVSEPCPHSLTLTFDHVHTWELPRTTNSEIIGSTSQQIIPPHKYKISFCSLA